MSLREGYKGNPKLGENLLMGNVKTKPLYDSAGFHVIDPATNLLVSDVLDKAAFDLWRCP